MSEETFRPSRRAFLGGVLALMATPVVAKALPLAAPALPIIRADGVWDDWAGLQALLNNEPFEVQTEGLTAIEGLLSQGVFRVSRPLDLYSTSFVLRGCSFIRQRGDEGMEGDWRPRQGLFRRHDSRVEILNTQMIVQNAHGLVESEFVIDRWDSDNPLSTGRWKIPGSTDLLRRGGSV